MAERGAKARRAPLSRERIVTAAMALADEKGEAGVTMRAVAARLGVEAMSLYNHVARREELLGGMVDRVFGEIELPASINDWKQALRDRTNSARTVLRRHPWAVSLMDSGKATGPALLRHHDAVLGALRAGGFSVAMSTRAFSVIDSYLYGFVIQELSLPFENSTELEQVAGDLAQDVPADTYPHLAEAVAGKILAPGYDPDAEFAFGLDLILGALQPDEV